MIHSLLIIFVFVSVHYSCHINIIFSSSFSDMPLLILIQQNRVMRRALSKKIEAIYEELHRPTNRHHLFTHRESAVGVTPDYYNDVTTIIGPTEEQQFKTENYDDVITVGLRHHATDDISESYDDVVIIRRMQSEGVDDERNISEDARDLLGETRLFFF
ncbi:uncharacterized protein [Chanodichthys erythropterus]|uniref:uncharacterized protein n=1 Tax=Chanodichthys erythropterus TaxID=933992 RepID=UPI00351EAB2F